MTRRVRIALAIVSTLVFVVLLLPLSFALPLILPASSSLSARMAFGTLWSGTLRDARLAGIPLGETYVGLLPLPLMVGEARLRFISPALRGTLVASPGRFGIAHATGPIDIAARLQPLPISQMVLDNARIEFRGRDCVAAEGPVRAVIAGDVGGIVLPGGMTGALRCDGKALLLPLVGQSGLERLDLRITGDGRWRADFSVRSTDPSTAAKLIAAGFKTGPRGLSIRMRGTL